MKVVRTPSEFAYSLQVGLSRIAIPRQQHFVEVGCLLRENLFIELFQFVVVHARKIDERPSPNEQVQLLHAQILGAKQQLLAEWLKLRLEAEVADELAGGSDPSEVGNHDRI